MLCSLAFVGMIVFSAGDDLEEPFARKVAASHLQPGLEVFHPGFQLLENSRLSILDE